MADPNNSKLTVTPIPNYEESRSEALKQGDFGNKFEAPKPGPGYVSSYSDPKYYGDLVGTEESGE